MNSATVTAQNDITRICYGVGKTSTTYRHVFQSDLTNQKAIETAPK